MTFVSSFIPYRLIYLVQINNVIYVLHCFEKGKRLERQKMVCRLLRSSFQMSMRGFEEVNYEESRIRIG